MHRAILQISPREKIAPDRRLRQSLKRFPDHHNTRPDAAADVAGKKTLCAVDLARAALPVSCVNAAATFRTPVAPTGWPSPIKPPPALTGKRPEGETLRRFQ
jgi:hypothetical protein